MKNKKYGLLAMLLALLVLIPTKAFAEEKIVDDGVIDLGTSADFPPYEYYEGDEIVGIDPDIVKAIAEELGLEVKLHDMDFNNIIASIQSGKVDGGAAGFTVTEERKKSVNFTEPFAKTSQIIVKRKDSDIEEIEDLEGKKLGTQLGSIGDTIAKDDFGEENVSSFNKVPDAILSLQSKKIDAVILDKQSAENFVNANKDLEIVDTPYLEEEYAIAVNKDNPVLLEKMNEAITKLKEEGEIDKIMAKYQGPSEVKESKGLIGRFKSTIRGTPSTIQLLIMFNVILVNLDNLVLVAIISFALNSSAYMAELFRGGINSVSKGEKEAARSLGLSNLQMMKKVVMPQAVKNSLPALGNEVITLFKETSIAGFIGLADLTRGASIVISQTFDAATAYFSAAIIYLVIVLVMEKIFKELEKGFLYA